MAVKVPVPTTGQGLRNKTPYGSARHKRVPAPLRP